MLKPHSDELPGHSDGFISVSPPKGSLSRPSDPQQLLSFFIPPGMVPMYRQALIWPHKAAKGGRWHLSDVKAPQ